MAPLNLRFLNHGIRLGLLGAMLTVVGFMLLPHAAAEDSQLPAPTSVQGEAVSTGLQISWATPEAPSDTTVGTLVGYQIERAPKHGYLSTLIEDTETTDTSYTDTSGDTSGRFTAGHRWYYQVLGIYEAEDGTRTSTAASDDVAISVPNVPQATSLERSNDDDGVHLTWNAPSLSWSQGFAPSFSGIEVTVIDEDTQTVVELATDDLNYTDADGTNATRYELTAVYGVFETPSSAFPSPPLLDLTPPPTGLASEIVTTGVKITWMSPNESFDYVTATVVGYRIQRVPPHTAELETVVRNSGNTDTEYTDTAGGHNGTFGPLSLLYRVMAIYEDEDDNMVVSDPSDYFRVDLPSYARPESTTRVNNADGGVDVGWDAPEENDFPNSQDLTGYELAFHHNRTYTVVSLGTDDTSYHHSVGTASTNYLVYAIYGAFSSSGASFPDPDNPRKTE